jgi:hypothetical protein
MSIIGLLECLLTLLLCALGIAAVFWILAICIKAIGGTEPPANLMMVMYAIGVVILLIVAVSCILGSGPHLFHWSTP